MDSLQNPSPRLQPNSRIAVIGGGPAGSFFALHALDSAKKLGLPLQITLFERKDLTAPGPRGCNMCAGILSRRTLWGIAALDIAIPPEVVMGRVRAYRLHWGNHSMPIHPPDPAPQVLSVYRAGGPRTSPYAPMAGFDAFLLDHAQARGARMIRERVERVSFDPLPRVQTNAREEIFDLVVLACGVNATPPLFERVGYLPPTTETMAQDALLIGDSGARARMDSTVHIYFDQPRELIFGALIPKRQFATVSLLGRRMARDIIHQFLSQPEVLRVVGDAPPQMCGCRPRAAIGSARDYFADRFVAVGDACVTRLYKDGIGSALVTARAAAQVALRHGITRDAFAAHYAPVCRAIERDNRFGRAVFEITERTKRSPALMGAIVRALEREAHQPAREKIVSQILWSLFTGDASYEEIFKSMFKPRAVARIAREWLEEMRKSGKARAE
jgi:flavin-dependent dehydrogenase